MELKRHSDFLNEEHTQEDFNNPSVDKGERVEMIKMADDPAPIEPGEKGTVNHIDGIGQIHIDWDNGRMLAIVPEEDRFKLISESHSKYQDYFKGKLDEFEVESPKELTKDQWRDIDIHWHAEYENDYSNYFKAKLKEFGVDKTKDLSKDQWKKIDKGWISKDEKK